MKATIFLLLALLVPVSGSVHAEEDLRAVFLEREHAWTDALGRSDRVQLERLLHPDFTLIGAGAGTVDPIVSRAVYLRNAIRLQWPRRQVRILDVQRHADTAVVRCVWRGENPPPFPVPDPDAESFEFLLTDIWVRGPSGWQVLARHSSFPGR